MSLDKVSPGKNVPESFNVIIEIPMNADPVKYEVDKESGAIFVDRFMSTSMHYPTNYGYVPKTISGDGDPVDVLVITPVPTTSVYSRSDGIVAWQASLQAPDTDHPRTENVEVLASHIGLGLNPSAWWVIADRLAQPEGEWKPFARKSGLHGLVFPDPDR